MAKTKVFHPREGFTAGVKEAEDVSQNLHVIASAFKYQKNNSKRNGILPVPTGLIKNVCFSGGFILAAPERGCHDTIYRIQNGQNLQNCTVKKKRRGGESRKVENYL